MSAQVGFICWNAVFELDDIVLTVLEFDLIDPFSLFSFDATFRWNDAEIIAVGAFVVTVYAIKCRMADLMGK